MKQNLHFITFGSSDGQHTQSEKAAIRLKNQAMKSNLFDYITAYNSKDLKDDSKFWQKHEHFIKNNKKGYGCYLWKPYLIRNYLKKMSPEDILIYCDAGFEIILDTLMRDIEIKLPIMEQIQQNKILGFYGAASMHYESLTKTVCYDFFKIQKHQVLNTHYIQTGLIAVLNEPSTTTVIEEWWNTMDNHYYLYDNTLNDSNPNVVASRHDQMILNLVLHKNKYINQNNIIKDPNKLPWAVFNYARNRSGTSRKCTKDKCCCDCCVN